MTENILSASSTVYRKVFRLITCLTKSTDCPPACSRACLSADHVPACAPAYPSARLLAYPTFRPHVRPPVRLSIRSSACLPSLRARLSAAAPPACPPVCQPAAPPSCPPACVSPCLSDGKNGNKQTSDCSLQSVIANQNQVTIGDRKFARHHR